MRNGGPQRRPAQPGQIGDAAGGENSAERSHHVGFLQPGYSRLFRRGAALDLFSGGLLAEAAFRNWAGLVCVWPAAVSKDRSSTAANQLAANSAPSTRPIAATRLMVGGNERRCGTVASPMIRAFDVLRLSCSSVSRDRLRNDWYTSRLASTSRSSSRSRTEAWLSCTLWRFCASSDRVERGFVIAGAREIVFRRLRRSDRFPRSPCGAGPRPAFPSGGATDAAGPTRSSSRPAFACLGILCAQIAERAATASASGIAPASPAARRLASI